MSFEIEQADLVHWKGFFDDGQVNADVSPKPGAAVTVTVSELECVNKRFWGLKFSQDNTDQVLPEEQGSSNGSRRMALAKDTSKTTGFSFSDILKNSGLSSEETGPQPADANLFMKIVSNIPTAVDFFLDPTDTRNAMWLTPGITMRIDTALTFSVPDGAAIDQQGLTGAIMKDLGIGSLPKVPMPTVIVQRTCYGNNSTFTSAAGANPVEVWTVTSTYRITFKFAVGGFLFWISLTPVGMSVSMTKDPDSEESIWTSMLNLSAGLKSDVVKPVADVLSNIELAQLSVGRDAGGQVWWMVTSIVNLQKENSAGSAVEVYLTYDSLASSFSGGLITAGFYATPADRLGPDYEPGLTIDLPKGKSNPAQFLDLAQYFADPASLPKGLPLAIAVASITLTKGPPDTVAFAARAVHAPSATDSGSNPSDQLVRTPFVWEELSVFFSISRSTSNAQPPQTSTIFSCSLSTLFTLNPPAGTDFSPAHLGLRFDYSNAGDWMLLGYAENLSCGLLFSFFEKESSSALLSMLGKLNIASLSLLLTHDKSGSAASFVFTGIIDFGDLQLRLFYQYTSSNAGANASVAKKLQDFGGKDAPALLPSPPKKGGQAQKAWLFECDLGASSGNATIGSIANSILKDAAGDLPSFIADIKIPSADGSNGRAPIYLKATKTTDNKVLFVFRLSIGSITLTFVQITQARIDPSKPQAPTKRLIRFAIDKIPLIENIPLLNKLPQPFDELEYVWVNQAGGFLKSEVDAFTNAGLLTDKDALQYKASGKTDSASKDVPDPASGRSTAKPGATSDPVVLSEGHHFIVIHEGKAVVDHVFYTSPKPSPTPALRSPRDERNNRTLATLGTPGEQPKPSSPAKGALSFKFGPLAIDAVTLQFKEQAGKKALAIVMDATFTMGPITFSLLGFGLAIALEGLTLDKLSHALDDDFKLVLPDGTKVSRISAVLSGLALSFNKPPLLIAGGFEHAVVQVPGGTEEIFMGGIGVTFPPYTFVGLGQYKVVNVNGQSFKSVFLFAKLDGPLVTLEFATISGVRLGLGYNSVVRPPSIDELTDFPFINDHSISGAGNDPMAILKSMTGGAKPWVTSKLDSYWFAAGMSITAFDLLTVTAVAMLAFRDSGIIASIYADAIAQMPPDVPKEAVIVYAEIGMVAEMNFVDGYFRVEAALAPTSFLLVPQCHLYGGFALVYWFPPSDHAGDWVFSIGGYHRSYTPPPWYPVPKRLGISFNVDIISITGEAYFAITPKCVMGGAMLHASLSFGPIEAWLDATFDALIQFHPLHYSVDFSVSIGVNFNLDILFVHIHISVHVGAQLHIEGPEFGGVAHVDFWLLGFDVDFGASPQQPPPLDLLEFWLMLHKPGPDTSSDPAQQHSAPMRSFLTYNFQSQDPDHKTSPQSLPGAAFKYALEDGNFPMPATPDSSGGDPPSTGAGSKWYVKGGSFTFRIASDFALSAASIKMSDANFQELKESVKKRGGDPDKASQFRTADLSKSEIYSKPMHITASRTVDGKKIDNNVTSTLTVTVVSKATGEIIDSFRSITLVTKDVPTAIWDAYDPAQDPQKRPDALLNGDNATVKQCMSTMFAPPLPYLSPPIEFDDLGLFIPKFKATAAAKFGILDFRTSVEKGGLPADTVHGTDWFVPKSEALQRQYLPKELTAEEKKMANKVRWQATRTAWNSLASKRDVVGDQQKGVLATLATTLGWDQKRPQTETTVPPPPAASAAAGLTPPQPPIPVREPWQLVGGLPSKMIANLEAVYLDLPRMALVSA